MLTLGSRLIVPLSLMRTLTTLGGDAVGTLLPHPASIC